MTTSRNSQDSPQTPFFENLNFLTISHLSALLSVPEKTIRHWVYRREIPHYKIGRHLRFDPREVQKWISERKVQYEC